MVGVLTNHLLPQFGIHPQGLRPTINQKNEISSQGMVNKNKINYEALRTTTDGIFSGRFYINSLSFREEQGRIKGGRRNVEAALILGAGESTGSAKQKNVEEQEKLLIDFAQKSEIWIDESSFEIADLIAEESEAKVYYLLEKGVVIKVVNYRRFSKTPLDHLNNRITLHNYLFSGTTYQLVGFTNTEDFTGNKKFAFVVEQPFVKGRYIDFTREEGLFRKEAQMRGFNVGLENYKPVLFNVDYVIKDLHEENIIIDEQGNFLFIDTVPALNTPESGFYGTRKYGNGGLIGKNYI